MYNFKLYPLELFTSGQKAKFTFWMISKILPLYGSVNAPNFLNNQFINSLMRYRKENI